MRQFAWVTVLSFAIELESVAFKANLRHFVWDGLHEGMTHVIILVLSAVGFGITINLLAKQLHTARSLTVVGIAAAIVLALSVFLQIDELVR